MEDSKPEEQIIRDPERLINGQKGIAELVNKFSVRNDLINFFLGTALVVKQIGFNEVEGWS